MSEQSRERSPQLPDDHPLSDVRITVEDDNPVIDFGDGVKLKLRTTVKEWTHERPRNGEAVDMAVETDVDQYTWWTLYPERAKNLFWGTDAYPEIVIEPTVVNDGGGDE